MVKGCFEKLLLLGFDLLLLLLKLKLQLGCLDAFSVARLGTLLFAVTGILLVFSVIL